MLQMEEIESLNRILITGQRRVYTVEPFQLGHNTNKKEKGAGISSLCWALGIHCLAQTDSQLTQPADQPAFLFVDAAINSYFEVKLV